MFTRFSVYVLLFFYNKCLIRIEKIGYLLKLKKPFDRRKTKQVCLSKR